MTVDTRIEDVRCTDEYLTVSLVDDRQVSAPLTWFPRLLAATPEARAEWELSGAGHGIHWPKVDEDLSVAGLLRGEHAGTPAQLRSLVGTFRRFGPDGPVYEIISIVRGVSGEIAMRIRVVESGEELDYRLAAILEDPKEA